MVGNMRSALAASLSIIASIYSCSVDAHGDHGQSQEPMVAADADWAARHMAEEHHITDFDAGSFFRLHDFDGTNEWTSADILTMYGLHDESTAHISQGDKAAAAAQVISMYDRDASGTVSFAEFVIGEAQGTHLPDFGYGPGHHGDDEYEYEIHHFEKFHGPDATEEELTHPEDIEHFRKHDMLDEMAERQERLDRMTIVEANIPLKFRRNF